MAVTSRNHVKVQVYDVLGNEIKAFVNEEKPAGTYESTWDAKSALGGLPSGVYWYKLQMVTLLKQKK